MLKYKSRIKLYNEINSRIDFQLSSILDQAFTKATKARFTGWSRFTENNREAEISATLENGEKIVFNLFNLQRTFELSSEDTDVISNLFEAAMHVADAQSVLHRDF